MINFLAANGDIPITAVTAIIGAIFAGLGVLAGKMIERKAQSNDVTLKNQPIGVVKHQPAVTWEAHQSLMKRVDRHELLLDAIVKESGEQFKDLLESASNREARIIDKIDDVARAIHSRIDELMKGGKR